MPSSYTVSTGEGWVTILSFTLVERLIRGKGSYYNASIGRGHLVVYLIFDRGIQEVKRLYENHLIDTVFVKIKFLFRFDEFTLQSISFGLLVGRLIAFSGEINSCESVGGQVG
jgi:hypothetical protein